MNVFIYVHFLYLFVLEEIVGFFRKLIVFYYLLFFFLYEFFYVDLNLFIFRHHEHIIVFVVSWTIFRYSHNHILSWEHFFELLIDCYEFFV